jgi:hypothetical protein
MDISVEETRQGYLDSFPGDTGVLAHRIFCALSTIQVNFAEYRAIFGKKENFEVLNWAAPAFFARMQWTLLADVILAISRLTDPPQSVGQPNASLRRLVRALEPHTDAQTRVLWTKQLSDIETAKEKIKTVRNKLLSHDDLAIYVQGATTPAVSRADVEGVLTAIRALVNSIESTYMGSPMTYELAIEPLGGAQSLVNRLAKAMAASKTIRSSMAELM